MAFNGWAQAIIRAIPGWSGEIAVTASAGDGIAPSSIKVRSIAVRGDS